ncbi:MAG TPA: hypothetical protein VK148_11030 [Xanthobacteraceae bacterium]|nr:hypothetical protein [Xanthobacteraceae bacterium]
MLVGSLGFGDIFVRPCDAAYCAIWIEQWCGSDSDIDHGAVFSPALDLKVPDALAVPRPLIEPERIRALFRRHDHYRSADSLFGGVPKESLGRTVPQHYAAIKIGAHDRHRGSIDNGGECILGLQDLVLPAFERHGHPVQSVREISNFIVSLDLRAMAKITAREHRRIIA